MGAAASASASAPTREALGKLPETAQAELTRVAETLNPAMPAELATDEAPPAEGHARAIGIVDIQA